MHPKQKPAYRCCFMSSHCCQSKRLLRSDCCLPCPQPSSFLPPALSSPLTPQAPPLLKVFDSPCCLNRLLLVPEKDDSFPFFRCQLRWHHLREPLADLSRPPSFILPTTLFISFITLTTSFNYFVYLIIAGSPINVISFWLRILCVLTLL